ncbi:HipA domain-containing protein [Nostocoides sp. HKS02]|uniref:HipA domain-containing protein n=1 Tax=Nostocoides sp. HKS02 TaxID=1813880 RepID=UPI0012B4AB6E|nr:HipA domain-containing protein [Tetrasphaera sp. HKS02]QGN58077.1 hypothetical protein GKE56_09450 [Tetrasphaera sp. HKS02]
MKARTLSVWRDGTRIAELVARRPGKVECRYTDEALDAWPGNVPLMSCSLPLRTGRLQAWAFTTGLLPEGQHRQAMAGLAGVPTHDVIGMLARFGRDVAGALVISDVDPPVRDGSVDPYSAADLEVAVAELADHPLGLYEDSELSIAGLADKMLLAQTAPGRYGRPRHGAPSTHILKVDDRTRTGLVRAEHACLELARSVGVPAAASELMPVGDTECIIVTRYDRRITEAGVERVHQEDACQALGIDPEGNQRKAKYERHGGPSLADVAGVLERWAADPDAQLRALLRAAAFTVLIGNADAHGKNVSLLHPQPGQVALAPLYDTVPTAMWPKLRREAAMAVNGRWHLPAITQADLVAEAAAWGLSPVRAQEMVVELAEAVRTAAGAGLRAAEGSTLSETVAARADKLLTSPR